MPDIVARSVIASRNSDPLSENLTNAALDPVVNHTHVAEYLGLVRDKCV